MSRKDVYHVKIQEHILDGTNDVEVRAGCQEEAEIRAKELLSEWLDPSDLTILECKRVKINEKN